jgi:hypothetical protein
MAACFVVAAGCAKKNSLPTPAPTPAMRDYVNRIGGKWMMQGQSIYQCWLCAPQVYETTEIVKRINVYVMDDTTISVMDTIDPGNAKVMYLEGYDSSSRKLSFVSPNNGMYRHSFVHYYIANDSMVYDKYSRSSGSSWEDIVHTP